MKDITQTHLHQPPENQPGAISPTTVVEDSIFKKDGMILIDLPFLLPFLHTNWQVV